MPCGSPHTFGDVPIDGDPGVAEKGIQKRFRSAGKCQQLGKYRGGNDQAAAIESVVERGSGGATDNLVRVSQSGDDVRIDDRGHRPRILRT
jgi:hypothetical protein